MLLNYDKTLRSRVDVRLDRCDFIIGTGELCVLFENDTESVANKLMHSIERHASWSAKFRSDDLIVLVPYLISVSTTARKLSLT